MIKQSRLDPGRYHVDFRSRNPMLNKPIPEFRRNRRDVIRENRSEPIKATRQCHARARLDG